jgi:hypothetical protein
LVFPVATLNLLVDIFLHVTLKNARPCWFVKPGSLQNVGGVDPVIFSTAHYMLLHIRAELVFVDGDLQVNRVVSTGGREQSGGATPTPLYVALYIPAFGWSAAILSIGWRVLRRGGSRCKRSRYGDCMWSGRIMRWLAMTPEVKRSVCCFGRMRIEG